jgi:regulator of nonsense transcripts 1
VPSSAAGTSFLNRTEAANVEKIVTRFLLVGLAAWGFAVVSPQKNYTFW